MSYKITQRMRLGDSIFQEAKEAKTPDEAMLCCRKLAGIYKSVVNERFAERIRNLEAGKRTRLYNGDLKLSLTVRRTKT